jgi:hypothetical protein
MKRIFAIAFVFIGFPVNSYANGYCDGRGSQQAIAKCYRDIASLPNRQDAIRTAPGPSRADQQAMQNAKLIASVETNTKLVSQWYEKLMGAPEYPNDRKVYLEKYNRTWTDALKSKCKADNACLLKEKELYVGVLQGEYSKYHYR